jgi:copper chaperone
MISFEVNDMTCGHCVSTITKALKGEDPNAIVQIDLANRRVAVASAHANAAELRDAIREAGYTPLPAESPAGGAAVSMSPARKGCCCG